MRKILLSGLGMGYAPFMPGTWGSFLAVVLWLAAVMAFPSEQVGWLSIVAATLVCVMGASAVCIGFGDYAIEQWKRKDPSRVVIDEVAGQWLSLLPVSMVPVYTADGINWMLPICVAASFVFFRIADVIKPPPARQAEALPAGIGILADDLLAGVYACFATLLVVSLLTRPA